MKNLLFVLAFLAINKAFSQTTIILQPNSTTGKDVIIDPYYPNITNDTTPEFNASAWTNSGLPGIQRSLIDFDLSVIPVNATIQSATLTLYNNPSSLNGMQNGEHSHISGSNESVLQRIISSWQINNITWNNQPSTDTLNQVILPQDTNVNQDYILDVTALIQNRIQNPSNTYGFMLKLVTEQQYRCLVFASSNHPDSSLHPKLEVTYLTENCITIQPDSITGRDVIVDPYYATITDDTTPEFNASAWTNSGSPGIQRSLIDFDLSTIPSNAVIQSATLTLFNDPTSLNGFQNGEHSHVSGSNESVLQRIVTPWQLSTVNWNNQPATDTLFQVILPQDTNVHQDYFLDITNLMQDRISNPSGVYGFMLKLATEQQYRCLVFASSNHPNPALHPKLELCYSIPSLTSELINSESVINIFPNPAHKFFTIQLSNPSNKSCRIILMDILGNKILEEAAIIHSGYSYSVNIEKLAAGVYFVLVETDKLSIKRLVVN